MLTRIGAFTLRTTSGCGHGSGNNRWHQLLTKMRMPGVEPGSQAWGACMMPLHYMRHASIFAGFRPVANNRLALAPAILATRWQLPLCNTIQFCKKCGE